MEHNHLVILLLFLFILIRLLSRVLVCLSCRSIILYNIGCLFLLTLPSIITGGVFGIVSGLTCLSVGLGFCSSLLMLSNSNHNLCLCRSMVLWTSFSILTINRTWKFGQFCSRLWGSRQEPACLANREKNYTCQKLS